ncbi:2,4-dienoyl-CoA reductase [Bacillus sp. AL-1R]
MKDKVVIITGGSSGLGKAIAMRFAKEGAKVVIVGRDLEKLNNAKEEIEQSDGQVLSIAMDVRNPELIKNMVNEVDQTFGTIDFLVNNTASNFICAAEDLSVNGWNTVINSVLNGTFYCSSEVGRYMIQHKIKGAITNIIATYAWDAGPGVIHSASAKAGVLAMTRTLAVEWGRKYGIRVNAIASGPIERTDGAAKLWLSDELENRTIQSVPLGRLGTPEEIAGLCAYIFSNEAGYINGSCFTMDGGQSLHQYPF